MLPAHYTYVDDLNMHPFLPVERVSFKATVVGYLMNLANRSYCGQIFNVVH